MSSTPRLYGIHYSPWTQRARWALDHHGIVYRYHEHVPLLGEGLLRRRARRAGVDTPTVPLWVDGDEAIGDSAAIMAHADRIGGGASLGMDRPEVAAWADKLEPLMQALRRQVTRRTLKDRAALTEAASAAAPGPLAALGRPIAAMGARHIARKYGFEAEQGDESEERAIIVAGYEALRQALGGRGTIFEAFTGADIIAGTCTQGLSPHPRSPIKPHTRRMWANPDLADAFADLVAWRDRIYDDHPPRRRR